MKAQMSVDSPNAVKSSLEAARDKTLSCALRIIDQANSDGHKNDISELTAITTPFLCSSHLLLSSSENAFQLIAFKANNGY